MQEGTKVQHLMPLMREYGSLERQRLGAGVTPLEFQRWLDLKGQIGKAFSPSREGGLSATGDENRRPRPTRLLVSYRSRNALLDSIIPSIRPAGFYVGTPFAAEVGTSFLVRLSLDREGESAEIPAVVVTSFTQGAHTLSTMDMGMSLKISRPTPAQVAQISQIFATNFDDEFGSAG